MTLACRKSNDRFEFHNANPKGYVREADCITRAIATVLEKPWGDIALEQGAFACASSRSLGSQVVKDMIMEKYHYVNKGTPRKKNGRKYTVEELAIWLTINGHRKPVLVGVSHHMTALKMIDGQYKIHDTWDCGDMLVLQYYISETED